MAVFRVEKSKDYSVMANFHFRDRNLSWKAKGILSNMLSLPDDWDYSLAGLEKLAKDGETSTRSAIKELEENGYLLRKPVREKGRITDWEYIIFEKPKLENQVVEEPVVENPQVENQGQYNTNQLTTNKQSTKQLSINNKVSKKATQPKTTNYDLIINENIADDEIKELMWEFIKMRQMKKKPLTDFALTKQINKLYKISQDIEQQKEIIERTIVKNWDEFYPISQNEFKSTGGNNGSTRKVDGSKYAQFS